MMAVRARQAAAERKIVVDRTNAPGPKRSVDSLRGGRVDKPLRNTNQNLAYFGTVTMAQMLGTTTLANFRNAAIGSIGTLRNTGDVWLKFALNGKILFVARKNLTSGVSWNQIYSAQAAGSHGTSGVGGTNTGGGRNSGSGVTFERSGLNQNKTFTPGGQSINYDVRLLTGGTAPIATTNGAASGIFNFISGGEWDELLVSVSNQTAWNKRDWAIFTNADLGIRTDGTNGWRNNFHASWVQNNAGVTSGFATFNAWGSPSRGNARMLRGFGGRRTGTAGRDAAIVHPDLSGSNTTSYVGPNGPPGTGGGNVSRTFYAWRPVLEVRNVTLQVSGGGRGGNWKGIPRDIPSNSVWSGA